MKTEQKENKFLRAIWGLIPWIMVALIVAFILAMGYLITEKKSGLAEAKKAAMKEEIPAVRVVTLSLQPMTLADKISLPAQVEPYEDLWIKAEVSGQVQRVIAKEGQSVVEGQVLAELDPSDYKSRLARIEANYKAAKLDYDRMSRLVKEEIAAKTQFDEAEARLMDLSARLEEAKLSLDRTRITAPISGTLNEIKANRGDLLKVGDEVARILQYDKIKVTVGVPESDVAAVFDLEEADIIIESLEKRNVRGTKVFLSRQPRSLARLYDLELMVPNPDGRILPGMFARVELIKSVFDDALVIPLYAVISEGETQYVFVEQGSKAIKRRVELGILTGWQVQILSGLETRMEKPNPLKNRPKKTLLNIDGFVKSLFFTTKGTKSYKNRIKNRLNRIQRLDKFNILL